MTLEELQDFFEKTSRFDLKDRGLVFNSGTKRPDLHAFLLLDKLTGEDSDIVSAATHDMFFLDVDIEAFARVAEPELLADLVQCGVMYDKEFNCFCMFA